MITAEEATTQEFMTHAVYKFHQSTVETTHIIHLDPD